MGILSVFRLTSEFVNNYYTINFIILFYFYLNFVFNLFIEVSVMISVKKYHLQYLGS
jgi:hypothetical protein